MRVASTWFTILLGLVLCSAVLRARPWTIFNTDSKAHTYTATGSVADESGKVIDHLTVTVSVPANDIRIVGGPFSDVATLKGYEFADNIQVTTLALNDKTSSLFFPDLVQGQTALLLADAAGMSDVFSFFDFGKPNSIELIANAPFTFIGFGPGGVPILQVAGTNQLMTDAAGNILPQFQFAGKTEVIAAIVGVPEPATFLTSLAFLALIAYGSKLR